jgi:hypothetical protein
MKLAHIKFPNEQYGVLKLWGEIRWWGPDLLVGEDFRLFRVDTADHVGLISDRILAQIDLLHYLWEMGGVRISGKSMNVTTMKGDDFAPRYTKQMPGERSIITDKWLRDRDLWRTPKQIEGAVTGDSNHAMDALRHLIIALRKECKR